MEPLNIQRILCPTDFSGCSSRAFERARVLARLYGAHIEVLHVFPVVAPVVGDLTYAATIVRLDEPTRRTLTEDLRAFIAPALEEGIAAKATLVEGDPPHEILKFARAAPADVIVMGTVGRHGLDRWLIGSVAENVMLRAGCPVLTVGGAHEEAAEAPGREHQGLESILCPLDLREHSVPTLRYAVSLSRKANAPLTVLHVLEGLGGENAPGEALSRLPLEAEYRTYLEARARGRLRSVIRAANGTIEGVSRRVVAGKAHKEILSVAAELRSSLIVMGLHDRSPLAMSLFGSTTQ